MTDLVRFQPELEPDPLRLNRRLQHQFRLQLPVSPSTCSVLGRAFISCGLHKRRVCDLAVIRLKLPSLREGQPSHMALDDGRLLAAGVGGRGGSSEDRSGGRRDEGAESLRPVPKQRYVAAH